MTRRPTIRSGGTPTAPRRSSSGPSDGLRELSHTADVVVVDLPATELEAAGLGAAQLRQLNPSLIHAWMPPHAVHGPAADLPYDELLLWAWTGLAAQQPGATSDHPVAPVVPIITYEQGALGACAIAAALLQRREHAVRALAHGVGTPRGQRDEHVHPHRPPRHLPAVRRTEGRHRRLAAVPHVPLPRRGVAVRVRAHATVLLQAARSARPHGDHVDPRGRRRVRQVRAAPGPGDREREVRRTHGGARLRRVGSVASTSSACPTRRCRRAHDWAASETVAANDLLLVVPGGDGRTTGPGFPAVLSATPGSLEPSTATVTAPGRAPRAQRRRFRSTACWSSTRPSSWPGRSAVSCSRTSARVSSRSIRPAVRTSAPWPAASYSALEPGQGPGLHRPQGRRRP